jgi:hypothetical protein
VIESLIFLVGSLCGGCLVGFFASIIHTRKVQELQDEIVSTRETIRRNAYARGYENAKTGGLKRA